VELQDSSSNFAICCSCVDFIPFLFLSAASIFFQSFHRQVGSDVSHCARLADANLDNTGKYIGKYMIYVSRMLKAAGTLARISS